MAHIARSSRTIRPLLLCLCFLLASAQGACAENAASAGSSEWIFIPFPIYTPETGAAMTLCAIGTFRGPQQSAASSFLIALAYSEKEQLSLEFNPSISFGSTVRTSARVAFEDWPDEFFGLGNDTRRGDREHFASRNTVARIELQHSLGNDFWMGPIIDWKRYRIRDTEEGGLLETHLPDGIDGGTLAGLGIAVSHDTRDDTFFPFAGHFIQINAVRYTQQLGSDYSFARTTLDSRQYIAVGGRHVLALHQYASINRGTVPFQELSMLGDSSPALMRGYYSGRFRDRDMAVLQAEYRAPLPPGPWALAFFAGTGAVGRNLGELASEDLKWSGGAGLRYRASRTEAVNLRLDLARAEDSSGIYFNVFEAF